MKKIKIHSILLALALSLAIPAAVRGEDLRYQITARVGMEAKMIRARASITIPAEFLDAQGRVRLDVKSAGSNEDKTPRLHIETISAGGDRHLLWTVSEDMIIVEIPRGSAGPAETSLTVDYSLPLDPGTMEAFGYYLYGSTGPGEFWYPDVVGPDGNRARFRDFDVTLTCPAKLTIVTSGAPEPGGKPAAGSRVSRFVVAHVEGFALAAGEGFIEERLEADGTDVALFCEPPLAEMYRKIAGHAVDAIGWYKKTYGFFPVGRITIIQGHSQWGGGFPLPNAFMIHRGSTDPEFLRWITAHELGHYYWGLYVLGSTERLDWVQLANGIWADQLYMAEKTGRTLEQQWQTQGNGDWFVDYLSAMLGNRPQSLDIPPEEADALEFDYNSLVRHGKGATGLYLQARRLGKDRFLDVQKNLLKDYKYRPLPWNEFFDRIEKSGAEGAAGFFEKWRRGDACVNYSVSVNKMERQGEIFRYAISLSRNGSVSYPMTVEIEDEMGRRIRVDGHGKEDSETLMVDLAVPLARVSLDPDGVLPSLNASHPGIRRGILQALWNESFIPAFRAMAAAFLRDYPGDAHVRLMVIADLFASGQYREIAGLLDLREAGACSDSPSCRAAIYLARALGRLGRKTEAANLLEIVHPVAVRFGLENRLRAALDETK
jgi:hypothetical protein